MHPEGPAVQPGPAAVQDLEQPQLGALPQANQGPLEAWMLRTLLGLLAAGVLRGSSRARPRARSRGSERSCRGRHSAAPSTDRRSFSGAVGFWSWPAVQPPKVAPNEDSAG
jgi:hypothetical protein